VFPHIEYGFDASPPFYISLNVHDKILHNFLMDSGASHNVMPKVVMEEIGLEISNPYQDLYSFDSKKVKCLGLIKDMVVSLSQLPMKSVVMDIVVADIPPSLVCFCPGHGPRKLEDPCRWILHMKPLFSLEGNTRGYTESSYWHILSMIIRI
jgi:hypothetical protein